LTTEFETPTQPREQTVPVWVPFLALVVVLFVVSLIGLAIYGVVSAGDPSIKDADDLPVGWTQALTFLQDLVFVFVAWLAVKLSLGRVRAGDLGLNPVRDPARALGWAVLVILAFYLVGVVLAELFGKPDDQSLVDDLKSEDALGVLIAWGVLICVLAPIAEEVFFRGFMFTVFAKRLGVAWAAILDGIVFGLGHAGGADAIQLIALGAFGIGLCLLYWRTQSIIPGMALHALNKSITFAYTKHVDPALGLGIVALSIGTVVAGGTAVARRSAVAA
jgi:membrane protease YdiL (CAAX protease family)